MLPVSVDQQNVRILNYIALNLPIYVHHVLLQPVLLQMQRHRILLELIVNVAVQTVLLIHVLIPVSIVPNPLHTAVHLNSVPLPTVLCPTQTVVPALLKSAPQRMVLFAMHPQIYVLQVIAEQMQLPRKLCQIVKLSINVVDVQNANPNGIQTTAPKLALIP